MITVRSFDVFDTLLTRRTGGPASVFLLLGTKAEAQGLITITPAAFRSMRLFAETQARQLDSVQEPTLPDIHRQLAGLLGLSDEDSRLLLELELEIERDMVTAVPGMREYVESTRKAGAKIVFVSDMYLPSGFLRELLSEHRFLKPEDSVFVSCEHKVSKRDGKLFKQVLISENVDASNIHHIGNDSVADFSAPTRLGISSEHRAEGNLCRYESVMESFAVDTDGLSSLFAGASRLARLDLQPQWGQFKEIKDVSCGVVGPVLCAFVIWLLTRAKQRGIKRLYFLSRDGYILHQIAQRLQPALGFELDLRYLYGSRQAWHAAGLTEIAPSDQEWILDRADNATPRSVLRRLNVAPEEVRQSLQESGISESQWSQKMREEDYVKIWSIITEDKAVKKLILAKATAARQIAKRYFEQEGMMDGNSCAIVDLGWHGRMEMSLQRILKAETTSFAGGFYFGLHTTAIPEVTAKAETFLFGAGKPKSEIACVAPLLEMFCTAPHATLASYVLRGDKVEPSFRSGNEEKIQQWGLESLHASVVRFAERIAETLATKHAGISIHATVSKLLNEFSARPSLKEAIAWGSFPYEDGQAGEEYSCFLKPPPGGIRCLLRAAYYGSVVFLYVPAPRRLWNGGAEVVARANRALRIALKLGRVNSQVRRLLKAFASSI